MQQVTTSEELEAVIERQDSAERRKQLEGIVMDRA